MKLSEDQYYNIDDVATGLFKDRGSKFIAYLFPSRDEETFKAQLQLVKAQEPTARHHCWAFRMGAESLVERSNDDGEPGNTAGLPILRALQSAELIDVACVVVRYFGGTKLGVPGLIHAYGQACKEAVSASVVVTRTIERTFRVEGNYDQIQFIEQLARSTDATIVNREQSVHICYTIAVPKSKLEEILERYESNHLLRVRRDAAGDAGTGAS